VPGVAISPEEARALFAASTYKLAQRYAADGSVVIKHVSPDGGLISSEVQGTRSTPYKLAIIIRRGPKGGPSISGRCSCPVGLNCKHVAATLIAAMASGAPAASVAPTIPASAPPAPPRPPKPPPEPEMPWAVKTWLHQLGETAVDAAPGDERQRLFFIADVTAKDRQLRDLTLTPVVVNVLKSGVLSDKFRTFNMHSMDRPGMSGFLRKADRAVLRRLRRLGYAQGEEAEEDLIEALERVFDSGKGRWRSMEGPVLRQGPARTGRTVWRTDDTGAQRPTVELPEGLLLMRLPEPWYADPASGEMGRLDLDMPPALAAAILKAPEVPPAHAARVRAEIGRHFPHLTLPSPDELRDAIAIEGPPRPRLLLHDGSLPAHPLDIGRGEYYARTHSSPVRSPLATLAFRYGPLLRAPGQPPATLMHDRVLHKVTPDRAAEAQAIETLAELGFASVAEWYPGFPVATREGAHFFPDNPEEAWVDLMLDGVPRLREAGWEVEIAPDFPLRIAAATGEMTAALKEGSGIDWFELALGMEVDGERIDLAPALIDLLSRPARLARVLETPPDQIAVSDKVVLTLPDGRMLPLPLTLLRPILVSLLELFGDRPPSDGKLGFNRLAAAELAALEAASAGVGVVWTGGDQLLALGRRLRGGGGIPQAAIPPGFAATLRDYQARGVDWLQFLREAELGGVLADDMGLGKTVQTLAHLAIEKQAGRLDRPALIVCPTSLVPNWSLEAARFAPDLRVLPLHGPRRAERFGEIAGHDLVISTYPLLARDSEVLAAQPWHVLVLDEAQTIKNPDAATTKLVGSLDARQRIALSGTPLENHLGELWSLFHFLAPGFLGDRGEFQRRYRTPIEKGGDETQRARLVRRVRPFLLRRTKQEVAADLPPKTEITEAIEMAPPQRAIYESIRLAMHARVREAIAERGLARSGIIMLDALLKLRQACCDPRLLKLKSAKGSAAGSAKLDRLMEMVPDMLEEGRRILLFSQFTSMLALIQEALTARRIPFELLTGDTTDRRTPVARFQAGEVNLFLISLKAGGVGLNLTGADTVIHYDPWWNPAVEDQATDRAHRIGQTQAVFVHKLMVLGTVEEKMDALKTRKRALVDSILSDAGAKALTLSEEDIEDLFGG
jgi:superfamily II DNA or RNA helicase